jgi:glycosyltransferase involved in cell wall biosynthesis
MAEETEQTGQTPHHSRVPDDRPALDPMPMPPLASRRSLRIALAHDWLCGYRGGEAVLERLVQLTRAHHELAGLYVMFDDGRPVAPGIDAARRTCSWIGKLPGASGPLRRWLLPAYPRAVASLSRQLEQDHQSRPIDLLITSSSAAIKGLRAPHGVPHLCYCHSPARYIWSQLDEYTRRGGGGGGGSSWLRGLGLKAWKNSFQRWDQSSTSADYVTRLLANSTYTAEQVLRCYERSAGVVFPPVRTEFFTPAIERMGDTRDDYWLYVGALEPYKRVDLALAAAKKLHHRLVIVGSGSLRASLEREARGSRVEFLGRIGDDQLREHYRKARLLLFPQVEDFGIVAVEAQACGLPVVARRAGGALDSVRDGQTGVFFDEPTMESLIAATIRCPRRADAACRVHAERFSEAAFDLAILREVTSLVMSAH